MTMTMSDANIYSASAVFNVDLENFTFRIVSANVHIVQDKDESIQRQKNSEHDNSCKQQTIIAVVKVLQLRRLYT